MTWLFPAGTNAVDSGLAVHGFRASWFRSRYLRTNSAMLVETSIEKPLECASVPYGSRRYVRLTYGKIGGRISHTDTALRTSRRELFVRRFLCALIDGFVYCGTAGNSALQFSCALTGGGVIVQRSNSARLSRFAQVIGLGGCRFPPAQNGSCIKLSSIYL
jgi:hypothetical protein